MDAKLPSWEEIVARRRDLDPDTVNRCNAAYLPGLLGMAFTAVAPERLRSRLPVSTRHLAPNGFLHAASVIGLADSTCGWGTVVNLPDGATGFTTLELKSNFLGTARDGVVLCEASPVHTGRSTQVWDARVCRESDGRVIGLFRCTQMILGG